MIGVFCGFFNHLSQYPIVSFIQPAAVVCTIFKIQLFSRYSKICNLDFKTFFTLVAAIVFRLPAIAQIQTL